MPQVGVGIRESAKIVRITVVTGGVHPLHPGRFGARGDVAQGARAVVKGGVEPRHRMHDDVGPGRDHGVHRIRQLRLAADPGQAQRGARRHLVHDFGDIGAVRGAAGPRAGVIGNDQA